MAKILIRDLDDEIVKRLKERARQHGRSLQGEAKLILTQAAGLSLSEVRQLACQWRERLSGREFPDSTDLVREDRQR